MVVSRRMLSLIKEWEGFSNSPYYCPAGIKTIGYGHVISEASSMSYISEKEAEAILLEDLQAIYSRIIRLIKLDLSSNKLDALLSFCFNVGVNAFYRSTLRQKLNRGEIEEAADEFLRWVYAGGKKLPGLIIRRNIERKIFLASE